MSPRLKNRLHRNVSSPTALAQQATTRLATVRNAGPGGQGNEYSQCQCALSLAGGELGLKSGACMRQQTRPWCLHAYSGSASSQYAQEWRDTEPQGDHAMLPNGWRLSCIVERFHRTQTLYSLVCSENSPSQGGGLGRQCQLQPRVMQPPRSRTFPGPQSLETLLGLRRSRCTGAGRGGALVLRPPSRNGRSSLDCWG